MAQIWYIKERNPVQSLLTSSMSVMCECIKQFWQLPQVSMLIVLLTYLFLFIKSVSMRKPGRSRQEVIQLKSPILLKLGTNLGFGE